MSSSSYSISDIGEDESEEVIKNIDPSDYEVYEDYVDAYINEEDVNYLQVSGLLYVDKTVDKCIISGYRGFQITFTARWDLIVVPS